MKGEKTINITISWNQKVMLDRLIEMYEDELMDELAEMDYVDEDSTESELLEELSELKGAIRCHT